MTLCYLQFTSGGTSDGYVCESLKTAKEEFATVAAALDRYGQRVEAYVYLHTDAPGDYPDYTLTYSKRGVKMERA
jgi:hypothetical protein